MTFSEDLQHIVRTDEPLAPHLWLGIGGPAQYFAEPVDRDELAKIVAAAHAVEMPLRILGGGSNILAREAGVEGVVVSLAAADTSQLSIQDTQMTAGAGARLSHAVIKAVGAGLGGLEHLVGIPGSVGAAVVGNVSSDGRDIGPTVHSVTVLDKDGAIRSIPQSDLQFSHRKTSLAGQTVLEVVFQLEQRDATELTKRLQKLWIGRNAARPTEERRIALPFVDPDGMPAKDLIQNVGLAGIREGDVSLDSANPHFLIAHDGATSEHCLRLIERVREQVLLQSSIDLQLNLQIW